MRWNMQAALTHTHTSAARAAWNERKRNITGISFFSITFQL